MDLNYLEKFKKRIIISISIMLSIISIIFSVFFIFMNNLMLASFSFTLLVLSLTSLFLLFWGLSNVAGALQVFSLLLITFSTVGFDSVGGIEDIFKIGVIGIFIFLLSLLVADKLYLPLITIGILIIGILIYFFYINGMNRILNWKDYQALLSVLFPILLSLVLGLLYKQNFNRINYFYKRERDRAFELAKNRTRFLSNMSHEIRTPLNGILGIIYLLESTNLNNKQRDLVHILKESGNSLRTILDDILDYSKIEKNGLILHESQFNLNLLIENIKKTLEPLIDNKKIFLNINIDEKIPKFLIGDTGKIKQVIINLINNSIKYTKEGCITISVNKVRREHNIIYINIVVKDSGEGIPKEQLDYIYEDFYQVNNIPFGSSQGVGLGLSISKKLVEKMNGQISVKSKVGEGTEFSVILPIKEYIELNGNKDINILVVDDNHTNLLIATTIIKKIGYRVETSTNGKEALELLSKKNFNIVFMDIHMPGLDGIEVAKIIRDNEQGLYKSNQVLIAVTATEYKKVIKKYKDWGMDDYMLKPIDPFKLQDIVEKWIKK